MTTKVTDKGIIYPDGTEQTTAAYGSGDGGSVDAYTKEETDNKFYDKEEIDSLLESSSGAIVANYTNKWASSVARDPGAGNLYLVAGMDFTMKYEDATRIYISDTDGDGALRNFDEVNVDDVITVTSDNGQGVFKLMSISELTGYRELVLNAESATGTIANDTPVQIVMDLATSGGSGTGGSSLPMGSIIMWSIPEVPEGWQICDGTNDTPDLRDKFVVGAGTTYALDATGGSADAEAVSHSHSASTNTTGNHSHTANAAGGHTHSYTKQNGTLKVETGSTFASTYPITSTGGTTGTSGSHTHATTTTGNHAHSVTVDASGVSGTGKNLPPYYSLYYIMKMVEGGGSGGGYTPEDMVWSSDLSPSGLNERQSNTVYTNDNDVPLYVQLYVNSTNSSGNVVAYINGKLWGRNGVSGAITDFNTPLFIVPSGSTYEFRQENGAVIQRWYEAKMPIAVGTGDSIWTEEDGKAVYNGTVDLGPVETEQKFNVYNFDSFPNNYSKFGFGGVPFYPRMYFPSDGNLQFGTMSKDGNDTFTNLMQLTNGGSVTTIADMWVNGIRVGQGGGATAQPESTVLGVDVLAANVSGSGNTGIGSNALRRNTSGYSNTAIGRNALTFVVEGANNTGVGSHALGACTGNGNTSIGESAGSATITGNNNTLIGSGAQPSSADVSNEVTIGNGSVTSTRLRGDVNHEKIGGYGKYRFNSGTDPYLEAGSVGGIYVDTDPSKLDAYAIVTNKPIGDKAYHMAFKNTAGICGKIYTEGTACRLEGISTRASDVLISDDFTGKTLKDELAIKDKLIEKLSARLDELEKRVK